VVEDYFRKSSTPKRGQEEDIEKEKKSHVNQFILMTRRPARP
jgi:hypothetical protein